MAAVVSIRCVRFRSGALVKIPVPPAVVYRAKVDPREFTRTYNRFACIDSRLILDTMQIVDAEKYRTVSFRFLRRRVDLAYWEEASVATLTMMLRMNYS